MCVNKKRLINDFLKLIRIKSPSGQEAEIRCVIINRLKSLGLSVVSDKIGNIIGRLPGSVKSKGLLFCAHMDTVPVNKTPKPRLEKDIIYSDGETILGADDKSGIAVILEMLTVIKETRVSHPDIEIVFTVEEETGLKGVKKLDFNKLKSRYCFVLDGTADVGTIFNQAPAGNMIEMSFFGKSAHAGANPEDGINAIQVASAAVSRMKIGRISKETTVNIGQISGGSARNIVPDEVTIIGEVRSFSKTKLSKYSQKIELIARQAAEKFQAGIEVCFTPISPGYHIGKKEDIIQLIETAMKNINIDMTLTVTGAMSDTDIFNKHGIKAVLVGTGKKNVHTVDEFIPCSSLLTLVQLCLSIIKTSIL